MNYFRKCLKRGNWIAIFLAITLAAGPISPVSAAPLPDSYGDLYIDEFTTNARTYCPGDDVNFKVRAGLISRALVLPIKGLQIQVNGVKKGEPTNEVGITIWDEPAPPTSEEVKKVKLNAIAVFPGYRTSRPAYEYYFVVKCTYDFQIKYDESYSVPMGEGTFTESATVTVHDSFSVDAGGMLHPKSGEDSLTAEYELKGVFSVGGKALVCTPKFNSRLNGVFKIGFSGFRKTDKTTELKLSQTSLSTGVVIDWACKDLNGRTLSYRSAAMPTIDLINRAKLNKLIFERNEGRKPITVPDAGVFWAIKDCTRKGWVALTLINPKVVEDLSDHRPLH